MLTIAKKCKQLKCPTADEWIKKIWYIHATEYYLTKRREDCTDIYYNINELWKCNAKWEKPVTKTTYNMIPFIRNVHSREIYRNRLVVSKSWREGGVWSEWWWMWGVLLGVIKYSKISGNGCIIVNILKILNGTL